MTALEDSADAFRAELALGRGLAKNTLEAYRRDLAPFLRHLSGKGRTAPGELVREDVKGYLDELGRSGRRASSRARAFVAIREFLAYLKNRGLAERDLSEGLEAPKKSRLLPRVLPEDVTAALVESVSGDEPRDLRDRAMLELLYGCGLRVSELCGLETDDIVRDAGVLRCRGKGSKERIVPIGVPAARALARYEREARDGFTAGNRSVRAVFVTRLARPFTRMGVFKMLRQRAEAAGIDPSKVSPHVLRHCFATHLLSGGADVRVIQELLGHASVSTTQIYTHVDLPRMKAVHRRCHPRAD